MVSILNEISKLRNGDVPVIDINNCNRYRLVAIEDDGSRTAYYFSTPIYNVNSRKLLDMKFHTADEGAYSIGSNAISSIHKNIKMENADGYCTFILNENISRISESEIICKNVCIRPTTNGVAIKSRCYQSSPHSFTIETNRPFLNIKSNKKYFALMKDKLSPFFSISCIGTCDLEENVIAPVEISYQKISNNAYIITLYPRSSIGESILIEANLYDAKLFQDTTVESKNPKENNVFGGIGFIGNTKEFGDQWLYSRLDFSKMTELVDKRILKAMLHIPKLNNTSIEMIATKVASRFCSFGSTWNNKIAGVSSFGDLEITDRYINMNLTSALIDTYGRIVRGDGFILRPNNKTAGFSVVATGDNYLTPQILEINYR